MNSYFIGDVISNILINGTGVISDLYFNTDFNVFDFTQSRSNENISIMTNLDVNNNLTVSAGSVSLTAGNNISLISL